VISLKRTHLIRVALTTLGIGLVLFGGLNYLAYKHARAMLCFGDSAGRTRRPEDLTFKEKTDAVFNGISIPRPVSDLDPTELAPDTAVLSIASTDSATLAAWYVNRGPATPLIILYHGYTAEKTALLMEACSCLELGTSVMLVDFRGSGGSSEAYTTVGLVEADDVTASMQYAHDELVHPSIILFGQSMGAAAILRAVHTQHIQPDGVILEAVFDSMFTTVCNRFELMHAPSFPSAQLLMFWAGRQWDQNSFAHKPVDYAASLTCPALFMHGTDDPRAKLIEGRRVFEAAPEPKQFLAFEAVAHNAYVTERPTQWKTAVAALIEKACRIK
jgi:pimeloyl-ACP methyl ester carboxylesterase